MKPTSLILKRLTTALTPQEENTLEKWLATSDENRALFESIETLKENGTDISDLKLLDSEKAWANILERYETQRIQKVKRRSLSSPFLKYAAIFIGVIGLSYGYVTYFGSKPPVEFNPSSDSIVLELGNGEIQLLSSEDSRMIADPKGKVVANKRGGRLEYTQSDEGEKLVFNTLNVPYGKKFQIRLSDNTLVHLNSGSSLRYPVNFIKGKRRQIFLEGEAYLDVSKDAEHPFIVTTSEMDVTVFGTQFNVSAYPEDKYISTVLVEGSVGLSSTKGEEAEPAHSLTLEPGYLAEWNVKTGNTTFNKVDTDIYTSWIEGRLVMKNFSFESIVKKLERHYNVSISNNYAELNKEVFTASFDIETIEEVLDAFAENRPFHYEVTDQTIIINKP